jgi:hypothetical protein
MLISVRGSSRAALAVLVAAVALGGCGGGESAGAPNAASGNDAQFQWDLKFTRCLREQGIQIDDPDPVKGAPAVTHDDAYAAASKTCEGKVGDPPSAAATDPKAQKQRQATALKQVKCLRDHGVDIKDPAPDEALQIPEGTSEDVMNRCFAQNGK